MTLRSAAVAGQLSFWNWALATCDAVTPCEGLPDMPMAPGTHSNVSRWPSLHPLGFSGIGLEVGEGLLEGAHQLPTSLRTMQANEEIEVAHPALHHHSAVRVVIVLNPLAVGPTLFQKVQADGGARDSFG